MIGYFALARGLCLMAVLALLAQPVGAKAQNIGQVRMVGIDVAQNGGANGPVILELNGQRTTLPSTGAGLLVHLRPNAVRDEVPVMRFALHYGSGNTASRVELVLPVRVRAIFPATLDFSSQVKGGCIRADYEAAAEGMRRSDRDAALRAYINLLRIRGFCEALGASVALSHVREHLGNVCNNRVNASLNIFWFSGLDTNAPECPPIATLVRLAEQGWNLTYRQALALLDQQQRLIAQLELIRSFEGAAPQTQLSAPVDAAAYDSTEDELRISYDNAVQALATDMLQTTPLLSYSDADGVLIRSSATSFADRLQLAAPRDSRPYLDAANLDMSHVMDVSAQLTVQHE